MARYRFDEIAINSTEKKKPTEEDKYNYIGLEHLDPECLHVTRFGSEVAPIGEKLLMKKGDVLFGKRRAYQRKVAIAPFDGIFSAHGMVLRPRTEIINEDLFPFFISSNQFLDAAIQISVGSLSPTINWRDLAELEFNLPPIEKQAKLAELLWAFENAKEAYKRLLTKTDELVKAQFIEMFGDPVTNDRGWSMVRLDELAEIKIGPFGSLLHKEDYIEGGHPLINPSHIIEGTIIPDKKLTISDCKYSELSSYQLKIGDVVLGRRGEMGRCAVVYSNGLFCGTGSLIIRSHEKMLPYLLQKIISYPSFKCKIEDSSVGVTMQNLNVPIVSAFLIPILPMELQKKYIALVELIDDSKSAIQQSLDSLEQCRNAIMEKVFG